MPRHAPKWPKDRASRPLARVVRAVALTLVAVSLPAPGRAGGDEPKVPQRKAGLMQDLIVTKADDKKTVNAKPGQSIVIKLDENPTTGYRWVIDKADDAILKEESSENQHDPGGGVGGGGRRVIAFKSKKAGTAEIRLSLRRAWEKEGSALERFAVKIAVTE